MKKCRIPGNHDRNTYWLSILQLSRNLGKFLPPYRWRFGQVGGFSEAYGGQG